MRRDQTFSLIRCEQGQIAFYTLMLLPFVVSLTLIGVDLSGWNALGDSIQEEVNRISYQAVQMLPDTKRAEQVIANAVSLLNYNQLEASWDFPTANGLSLELVLKASYRPRFDLFVSKIVKDQIKWFQVERRAQASLVPSDLVLILSDGATLRPGVLLDSSDIKKSQIRNPWGRELLWPASAYFECMDSGKFNDDFNPGNIFKLDWWNRWEDDKFQRWATQACFNPILTRLKHAAISLVDQLSASSANRIGLVFTPGDLSDRSFSVARYVRKYPFDEVSSNLKEKIGGFFDQDQTNFNDSLAEAHWYRGPESEIGFPGNEACVLFSDSSTALNERYAIPAGIEQLKPQQPNANCSDALDWPACEGEHKPFGGALSDCYFKEALRLRELIYWHSAKLNFDGRTPDFYAAIEHAWGDLVSEPDNHALTEEQSIRGNIAPKALRKIVLIADSLPDPEDSNFRNLILPALAAANIQVIFAVFEHQFLTPLELQLLKARAQSFIALAAVQDPQKRTLKILYASDPIQFQDQLAPLLISIGRQVVLKT